MLVDERLHGLKRRSSSAWAKDALALRRISLAWRSSRTSRSSALIRSCPCSSAQPEGPGRAPPAAPSGAASRASSRSWPQSTGSPHTGRCTRRGARKPSGPPARGPLGNKGVFAWSWLHPVRSWSLRDSRRGSVPTSKRFANTLVGSAEWAISRRAAGVVRAWGWMDSITSSCSDEIGAARLQSPGVALNPALLNS
jgi:hypothetical protein